MSESRPLRDHVSQANAVSAGTADTNLALHTSRLIERDLLRQAVSPSALPSEKDLMHRYGIGRPALREAIRILQCRGSIRMRRGPNGGLITVLPSMEKVVLPVVARLRLLGITEQQVQQARVTLSLAAARVMLARRSGGDLLHAVENSDDWRSEALRNVGFRSRFPMLLACASGNAALVVFGRLAAHTADGSNLHDLPPQANAEQTRWMDSCEQTIIAALKRADGDTTNRMLKIYHQQIDRVLQVGRGAHSAIPPAEVDTLTHRATRLARTIVWSILDNGFSGGERLGSLEELSAAFHASTASVQQALRILEADGVLRVRRGRGLGVFVSTPDPEAMATELRDYLHGRGFAAGDMAELIRALCIELHLQNLQASAENNVGLLSTFLDARPGDAAAFSVMSAWLQTTVAHNPLLGLLAKVLAVNEMNSTRASVPHPTCAGVTNC